MPQRANVVALILAVLLSPVVAAGPAVAAAPTGTLEVVAVSTRPDMVSGDDVLVRVAPGPGVPIRNIVVTRNGVDVSGAFVRQADGTVLGLVTGLTPGTDTVTATTDLGRGGRATGSLTVVDHPLGGPVFSGPQQTPYVCRTTESGLAPAQGASCWAPSVVTYRSRTVSGGFRDITDPARPPAGTATVTVNGTTRPYVVRVETGVVNRAVYQFVALWDGAAPKPTAPRAMWNGRLVYTYNGGCGGGYNQGKMDASGTGPANDSFLQLGYAIATSTLNTSGVTCNTVLSAETTMMVKERFAETYGPIVHTIGWGGSGGGTQQYAIADSYPGILDGIVPTIAFPNFVGNLLTVSADCGGLRRWFATPTGAGLTPDQRRAVTGYVDPASCDELDRAQSASLQPTANCPKVVPTTFWWDPVTNPGGIVCSTAQNYVNQLGVDPATGWAHGFVDNVGVQYGLQALLAGVIDPGQFTDLNATIGGLDDRGQPRAARSEASAAGVAAAYATNLVLDGGLGLRTTPVLDLRTYTDPDGSVHTSEWSYVVRQRMAAAGVAGNQVLLEVGDRTSAVNVFALQAMNAWLDALAADTSSDPAPTKIAATRPATLATGCILPGATEPVAEELEHGVDTGPCAEAYPVGDNPRLVAGQSLAMRAIKCRLTPLTRDAYPGIAFTDEQWSRLQQAFPTGVCDWSKPGDDVVAPDGTWLSYS